MKKIKILSVFILLSGIVFTSCKDIKGDAKKAADFECKGEDLYKKMMDGDKTVKAELDKLKEDYEKFRDETKERYKDASADDKKEFEKIFKEAKEACGSASSE